MALSIGVLRARVRVRGRGERGILWIELPRARARPQNSLRKL